MATDATQPRGLSEGEYRGAASLLIDAAAERFKLPITDNVVKMWESILVAVHYLDDRFDTTPNQDVLQREIANGIGIIAGDPSSHPDKDPNFQVAMESLKREVDSAEPERRAGFLDALQGVCQVTAKIKVATTARDYAKLTRQEGIFTLDFLQNYFHKAFGITKDTQILKGY